VNRNNNSNISSSAIIHRVNNTAIIQEGATYCHQRPNELLRKFNDISSAATATTGLFAVNEVNQLKLIFVE